MKNVKVLKRYVLIAIGAMVDKICTKPLDNITTEELARQMKVRRKLLQQGFHEFVGMGIAAYRNERRMEIARQLLKEGSKSIKEISNICRYKSQSAFTTAFRKLYGMSPSQWQEYQSKNSHALT
jgi:AraC-like DNA-binding protein